MSSPIAAASPALPPASSAAPAPADGLPTPRRWVAMAALLGGIVLVVLDMTIANVALPVIAQTLHATPAQAVWVATAYQLAVVVDDADQGITDVVRGEDLADNTPRQIALQQALHRIGCCEIGANLRQHTLLCASQ